MANKKISELDAITSIAADDVLPIVDVSAALTKKVTIAQLQTEFEPSSTQVVNALNGATVPTATVATGDEVLIQDVSDSNNLKKVTAQSIANLFAAYSAVVSGWTPGAGTIANGDTLQQILQKLSGNDAQKLSLAGGALTGAIDFFTAGTAASVSSANQQYIGVTSTASARTITISTTDEVDGRLLTIKDESGAASVNNISIITQSGSLIEGASTIYIFANFGSVTLLFRNSGWHIVHQTGKYLQSQTTVGDVTITAVFTTMQDLYSYTFNANPGEIVRIDWSASILTGAAGADIEFGYSIDGTDIVLGSNFFAGTQTSYLIIGIESGILTAGSHTIKIRIAKGSGGQTATVKGNASTYSNNAFQIVRG